MTPVSTSQQQQRAARLAPLASLDCSITDSRLSIVDTPTLNSYFECDQLSDMLDDSLFEITNTGCLSNSVFQRPHKPATESLQRQQQQMPSFLYSSYDYSASSRIPIAAQPSSRHRTSTRHYNQYNNDNITTTPQPATQQLASITTPKITTRTPTSLAPAKITHHSKLIKTTGKTSTTEKQQQTPSEAGRARKSGSESKKSKLGLGSFLGGLFDGNSKEVHRDKNAKLKTSQVNVTATKTASVPNTSMKSRSMKHKKSNNNLPLTTSSSCNDFRSTSSRLKSGGSEVLLLDQSTNRTLQRPVSATQLSQNSEPRSSSYQVPKREPEIDNCHQKCISTQCSEEQVATKLRPAKSVKFCMMDEVLTRPASSNPTRYLAGDGAQPASIIKRTSTVVKSSTCSQTDSSNNLSQLLAKYDKNSELIREISEKLQLTDTIASPCSILDSLEPPNEEHEHDLARANDERALHAILHDFCKSDLNLEDTKSTSTTGNQYHTTNDLLNNNNKQRAFM